MESSVGLFDAKEQLNSYFLVLRVSLLPQVGWGGVGASGGCIFWSLCVSLDNFLSVAADCSDVFSLK